MAGGTVSCHSKLHGAAFDEVGVVAMMFVRQQSSTTANAVSIERKFICQNLRWKCISVDKWVLLAQ